MRDRKHYREHDSGEPNRWSKGVFPFIPKHQKENTKAAVDAVQEHIRMLEVGDDKAGVSNMPDIA